MTKHNISQKKLEKNFLATIQSHYFCFRGRLSRRPFMMRTLLLVVLQFVVNLLLYGRITNYFLGGHMNHALFFSLLLLLISLLIIWAQLALGWRRFHDLNRAGAIFLLPFCCYVASYLLPLWHFDTLATMAQSLTAVSYLGLFTVKGTSGDNAYGAERAH